MAKKMRTAPAQESEVSEAEMRAAVMVNWTELPPGRKGQVKWELNEECGFEYEQTIPGTHAYIHKRKLAGGSGFGPSIQTVLVGPGCTETLENAYELEQLRPAMAK